MVVARDERRLDEITVVLVELRAGAAEETSAEETEDAGPGRVVAGADGSAESKVSVRSFESRCAGSATHMPMAGEAKVVKLTGLTSAKKLGVRLSSKPRT